MSASSTGHAPAVEPAQKPPAAKKSRRAHKATDAAIEPITTKQAQAALEPYEVTAQLAASWIAAGLQPPVTPAYDGRCFIKGCRSIPFIRLKLAGGSRNLWLCHYQSVKDTAKRASRAAAEDCEAAQS